MVTMKDIAEITGVSISTVSRVLQKKGNISERVSKKVLSACDELSFNKGVIAQSNNFSKYNIGLIIPTSGEYFNDDPNTSYDIRMIKRTLEEQGHTTKLYTEQISSKKLKEDNINAAIISDPSLDSNIVDIISESATPYIIINGIYRDKDLFQIDYDNYGGMKKIIQYLIKMGHKNIIVLAGPKTHMVVKNRLDGINDTISDKIINKVIYGDFNLKSGYERTKLLIKDGQLKNVTCIVALSDYIAIGAIKALNESKIRIPEDISITGFDNIEISEYTTPSLTTINRVNDNYAFFVINQLTTRINKNLLLKNSKTIFETDIIIRDSVKDINW